MERQKKETIGIEFDGIDDYVEIRVGSWYHITGDSENFSITEIPENEVTVFNRALSSEEIEDRYNGRIIGTRLNVFVLLFCGSADRVLTDEECSALYDLLKNHPEIKSWRIKNNILYLQIEED